MLTYDLAHVQDMHTGMCACAIVICVRNVLIVRAYRKLDKKFTSLAYCCRHTNLQRNDVINCEPTPTYTCETPQVGTVSTHGNYPKLATVHTHGKQLYWLQFLHMGNNLIGYSSYTCETNLLVTVPTHGKLLH